jgi:hypothetical protein
MLKLSNWAVALVSVAVVVPASVTASPAWGYVSEGLQLDGSNQLRPSPAPVQILGAARSGKARNADRTATHAYLQEAHITQPAFGSEMLSAVSSLQYLLLITEKHLKSVGSIKKSRDTRESEMTRHKRALTTLEQFVKQPT